jgi:hypothetical protein
VPVRQMEPSEEFAGRNCWTIENRATRARCEEWQSGRPRGRQAPRQRAT